MPQVSICIDVADIKQGTNFYANALGYNIKNEKQQSAELMAENVTIHLIEKEENSNPLIKDTSSRNYQRPDQGRQYFSRDGSQTGEVCWHDTQPQGQRPGRRRQHPTTVPACRCAIAETLTDDPEMMPAVKELSSSLF